MSGGRRHLTIAVRVDGGTAIGSGHVTRCLTLAVELRRRGAQVTFICRELAGHLIDRIVGLGFFVVRLPGGQEQRFDAGEDATLTAAFLKELRPDWLIVDHYGIDATWHAQQRAHVGHIMVIDDLANRPQDCDILLDQNYFGAATANRYQGRVSTECNLLLGPRFTLLGQEYSVLRRYRSPRGQHGASRCLIFFGGTDATNMTAKALRAMSAPKLSHLQLDVVIGMNHPAAQEIAELAAKRPGTNLYRSLPSLAGLLASVDLAIGAGGTTSWERLCLNVPSAVVTIADNQEWPTRCLAEAGGVLLLGTSSSVQEADIVAAVEKLIATPPVPAFEVDGLGAVRVAAAIFPPSADQLHLERATSAHMGLFLDWRNDDLTRQMSFDSRPVKPEDHRRWFEGKLSDPRSQLLVGMVGDLPVGQVRLDYSEAAAELSYAVEPVVRGKGIGARLVQTAIDAASSVPAEGFKARVLPANVASRRIFERLGWTEHTSDEQLTYRLDAAAATRQRSRLLGALQTN